MELGSTSGRKNFVGQRKAVRAEVALGVETLKHIKRIDQSRGEGKIVLYAPLPKDVAATMLVRPSAIY